MISVIIPAYNAQEYIGEALDSVLAQSFTDYEVIVVDDGSTDQTPQILADYASRDSRIRIITTLNQGVSKARNVGLDASAGEYIAFLDADDAFVNDTLTHLHSLIVSTGSDIAIGKFSHNRSESGDNRFSVMTGLEAAQEALYQQRILNSIWNSLFSRQAIGSHRFAVDTRYEDLDFLVRVLADASKVVLTDRIIYWYRHNSSSFINTYSPARFDVLNVTAQLEKQLPDKLTRAARDRRLSANFNMFGLIAANRDSSRTATADKCWALIKAYRRDSLLDPRVRLKNKAGILLSFLGKNVFAAISKKFYS